MFIFFYCIFALRAFCQVLIKEVSQSVSRQSAALTGCPIYIVTSASSALEVLMRYTNPRTHALTDSLTAAVDERSEVCFSSPQGTLPWQPIFVGFIGFYPQNWVRVTFGRWRQTTRSASAALDAGKQIN